MGLFCFVWLLLRFHSTSNNEKMNKLKKNKHKKNIEKWKILQKNKKNVFSFDFLNVFVFFFLCFLLADPMAFAWSMTMNLIDSPYNCRTFKHNNVSNFKACEKSELLKKRTKTVNYKITMCSVLNLNSWYSSAWGLLVGVCKNGISYAKTSKWVSICNAECRLIKNHTSKRNLIAYYTIHPSRGLSIK